MKKLIAATSMTVVLSTALVFASEGAPKFTIIHKGNFIEVSCNAGQGHLEHADLVEAISILISGILNC